MATWNFVNLEFYILESRIENEADLALQKQEHSDALHTIF